MQPNDSQSVPVIQEKPIVEKKKREPTTDETTTGTGPNKFPPAQQSKTGWRPGHLFRSLFPPQVGEARDRAAGLDSECRSVAFHGYSRGNRGHRIRFCRLASLANYLVEKRPLVP